MDGLRPHSRLVEATYEAPLLSHATMEPMNCTADVRADRCEIWAPTQNLQGTQAAAARLTGLPADRVTVHVTYLGCNGVDGIVRSPYRFAGFRVESHPVGLPVTIGHWRSVGVSQNTFFLESFLDELAHASRRDPVELRRELLRENPRALRVLDLAAEKAGWGTPPPRGRARGIAIVENKDSVVAEVAEVSIRGDRIRVHRVVAAADCGQIIHPGIVEAQIAGSVVGGLSAAFHEEVTLEGGAVKQRNFHEYQLLRLPDSPAVEVHIVPSTDAPGSVGEPGLPPLRPRWRTLYLP